MPNYSNLFSPPTSARSKFQTNPFAIRKFGKNPLNLFEEPEQQLLPAAPKLNPQAQSAAEEDAPFDFAAKYKELTANRPSRLAYKQALENEAPKIERSKWAKLGAAIAAGGSALGGMRADQAAQFGLSSYYAPQERADAEYDRKLSRLEKSAQFEDQDLALGLDAIKSNRDEHYRSREDRRQQTTSQLAQAAGKREDEKQPWTLESLKAEAKTRGLVFQEEEDGYTYAHNMVTGEKTRMGKTKKNDDEQIAFLERQLGVTDANAQKGEARAQTRAIQLLGMGHANDMARLSKQSELGRGDFEHQYNFMDKKGLDKNGNPKLKVDETNLAIRNAVNTMEASGQLPPGSSRFLRESADGFVTVGGAPTGNWGGGEERNPEIERQLKEVVRNVSGMAVLPGMIPPGSPASAGGGGNTTPNSPPAEPAKRGGSSIQGKNWFGTLQDSLGSQFTSGSGAKQLSGQAGVGSANTARENLADDGSAPFGFGPQGNTNLKIHPNGNINIPPGQGPQGHMPRDAGAEALAATVNPQASNKLNYPAPPPPPPASQLDPNTGPGMNNPFGNRAAKLSASMNAPPAPVQQAAAPQSAVRQSAGPGNPFMDRAAKLSSSVAQGIPGQEQAAGDVPQQPNTNFMQPMQQAAAKGNMQAAAQQAAAQRAGRQPAPQAPMQQAVQPQEEQQMNASRVQTPTHSVPMRAPNGETFYVPPEAVDYWKEQGASPSTNPIQLGPIKR